ncbi:GldG family protein [Leptothoe kymatousa]|uniref:Gldg family protein n=1 Tax=Leptothoe kymatousa TAU-MAC 1615 TaxID=2364775 RepID=A0ABS5XZZ0_9CYAN|nr:Gldg family protein [Leptothoe kymatousa]MBT9311136.1 Gldg family protein [Leptothoe kymatousa TAU-MAC 1615]
MKALSTLRPYLRWLIWPGLALTTAGLISGFVGAWTAVPVTLLVAGVALTQIGLFMGGGGYRNFLQSRSTQAGTNAVLATVSVLLILAVANFLAVQYGPRIDFTEGGLFTLAPETQAVVSNLRQPVNVVLFDASLNSNDKELLDSYQNINENLTYEYVNPFQNPGIAREFNVSGEGREVHLEVGDKKIFVQPLGVQGLNEQDLTNKLAQIGRDRDAVVYFLQGHDEFLIDGSVSGYAQAAAALEEDGFTVDTLNFDEIGVVPGDANALVIAGPKQTFFEPEVEILETYLDEGGSVLLMVDPQTNPELDSLLEEWGITLDERLIVDASNTGQLVGLGPAAPLVTDYGEHPITEAFDNGRSFYPLARPVLVEEVDGVEATPLLLSNAQSYAEELSPTGELNVDTEQAPEGPFTIGVVLTREIQDPDLEETEFSEESFEDPSFDEAEEEAENEETVEEEEATADGGETTSEAEDEGAQGEGRLVVIGNATFATDGLFGQQLNGDVFLNSVTWLSNLEDSILSIRAREITNRRITMTVSRQILVIVLALIVLPLLGLIGATVTWFRRR